MRYQKIERCSLVNGEGPRAVLWTQGCSHQCEGCQNPCTWNPDGGYEFDKEAEDLLFKYLGEDYCSGITFSGGDPLYINNREEVGRLVRKAKSEFPEKDIWLYTGYTWDKVLEMNLSWLEDVDVVVEGPFVLVLRNIDIKWRGSTNQTVVDVKKSLTGQIVPYCS